MFIVDLLERTLPKGTVLKERYRIDRFLGKGGYGLVYIALDMEIGQEVIVKQLRKRKYRTGLATFEKEEAILGLFQHSSIPVCYERFQEGKRHFLVMEWIKAKNFEQLIFEEGKTFNERESFEVLLQVLRVVKMIHEKGIVHRDLRIPNILLRENEIVIIDFGLAGYIQHASEQAFIEAEEVRLFREIAFRSDIYGLGHFVLFLLYSSYEDKAKERSWMEELSLRPKSLKIIKRMLQIDSGYQDVDQLIQDVTNFVQSVPTNKW
ncbi:protein kinase [Bacillus luteolus]|uniref:Protein kinase n=1 Tax=Litchfieldia luteola TaxID=682179 RepID=A0ABR9QMB1_9BACI|nr:protein kinase [Cytobacillus luteolus]MBE4909636.1 protein kinase [Cytobacillus luteolus]MBP1941037.1 serine/threonine-protein kinase [Cytobacillus luteolus]